MRFWNQVMRTPNQIKERVMLLLIEEINKQPNLMKEPENAIPKFLDEVSNKLSELVLDEISFRRKY